MRATIEQGLATMAAKGMALVPVRDRWCFYATKGLPNNPSQGSPLVTVGDLYRIGFWLTPSGAIEALGEMYPEEVGDG